MKIKVCGLSVAQKEEEAKSIALSKLLAQADAEKLRIEEAASIALSELLAQEDAEKLRIEEAASIAFIKLLAQQDAAELALMIEYQNRFQQEELEAKAQNNNLAHLSDAEKIITPNLSQGKDAVAVTLQAFLGNRFDGFKEIVANADLITKIKSNLSEIDDKEENSWFNKKQLLESIRLVQNNSSITKEECKRQCDEYAKSLEAAEGDVAELYKNEIRKADEITHESLLGDNNQNNQIPGQSSHLVSGIKDYVRLIEDVWYAKEINKNTKELEIFRLLLEAFNMCLEIKDNDQLRAAQEFYRLEGNKYQKMTLEC